MTVPQPLPHSSPLIAGSVLPIKRAEELLATLPGVIAARIIASENGAVDEIHVLTTSEVTPKQTVRNVESALIAHLGMRVDHRKISVATTVDAKRVSGDVLVGLGRAPEPVADGGALRRQPRRLYFEDVEVRRSRTRGVTCRVTLKKGDQSYIGEAEGAESQRSRAELAARATVQAIAQAEGDENLLVLDGCKLVDAFEREFVFVAITARQGRESMF